MFERIFLEHVVAKRWPFHSARMLHAPHANLSSSTPKTASTTSEYRRELGAAGHAPRNASRRENHRPKSRLRGPCRMVTIPEPLDDLLDRVQTQIGGKPLRYSSPAPRGWTRGAGCLLSAIRDGCPYSDANRRRNAGSPTGFGSSRVNVTESIRPPLSLLSRSKYRGLTGVPRSTPMSVVS